MPVTDNDLGAFRFATPEWLDEVASTSDLLKDRLKGGNARPGDVLAARRQTAGRGRMGNRWLSAEEGDVLFSFVWSGAVPLAAVGAFPLACGLGVRDYLAGLGISVRCKWPNDIMAGGAKVCGILTEGCVIPGSLARTGTTLVVGVGINVKPVPERDRVIGKSTGTIEELAGGGRRPEAMLPEILTCLTKRIHAWATGGFAALREAYQESMWGMGLETAARTRNGVVKGKVAGVDVNGELLLVQDDGTVVPIASVSALEEE